MSNPKGTQKSVVGLTANGVGREVGKAREGREGKTGTIELVRCCSK